MPAAPWPSELGCPSFGVVFGQRYVLVCFAAALPIPRVVLSACEGARSAARDSVSRIGNPGFPCRIDTALITPKGRRKAGAFQ